MFIPVSYDDPWNHRLTRSPAVANGSTCPAQPRQEITITLKDGNTKPGTSWETTPMDVAKMISKSLSERLVIAKVDGVLWDLERPLEGSVSLELLDFEHPEGQFAN